MYEYHNLHIRCTNCVVPLHGGLIKVIVEGMASVPDS